MTFGFFIWWVWGLQKLAQLENMFPNIVVGCFCKKKSLYAICARFYTKYGGTNPTKYGGANPSEYGGANPTEYGGANPTEYGGANPTKYGGTNPTK